MRLLTLVLARAGSKRCPDKNKRLLGDKPLIEWTLDVALSLHELGDCLVSTDDLQIQAISQRKGALAPWLRPSPLATDNATSVDAALHALQWYESEVDAVDGIVLLQPTSPFRTRSSLLEAYELMLDDAIDSVVSVVEEPDLNGWCFELKDGLLIPPQSDTKTVRSQDLVQMIRPSGSFYFTKSSLFKAYHSFTVGRVAPIFINSRVEAIDIDDEYDFSVAEAFCGNFKS